MRQFLVLLVVMVLRSDANLDRLDVEVEYQCIQQCPLQNRTDAGHYDYACDYGCNINQCAKGCKLWRTALNTSCQNVCNGSIQRLTQKDLYCVMGCNDAMTKYFSQLKSKLLIPPAPALVADSLNATSLKLEWSFPEAKSVGLSFHVQWKYEATVSWHYCRNAVWSQDNSVVLVEKLQPYTKYRFRVVLLLGHQDNAIVSTPSVVISTLPSGIPVSAPSSVRVAPIDCTRISVSWEPGPFPHGPLLSYVLQITDSQPSDGEELHSEVKDISPETHYYMFRDLKPSHNYTITARMRNGVGSGPSAKVVVSTPPEPLTKDTQKPVLILGTDHAVIQQGTDIKDEPEVIYSTLMRITGMAIHISKKLLFVADSSGYIEKMTLLRNMPSSHILTPAQMNFMPLDLSIDWLNDQLYILGEVRLQRESMWQIAKCDLKGRGLTVAVAGLRTRPNNIEVDPYNGYLFWSVQGAPHGGLYRLDISDISNGIKHDVRPKLILDDKNLGAFTVDHTHFRVMVSNQTQNTINSVSLDGKEMTNMRPNVIKSKLHKVVSLATANKKFYWTDGDDIFYEEYHNFDYFHNSYPDLSARSFKKVIINLQNSQPIPIPINPPINTQAIFGSNIAKTTWEAPHLLGIQGRGAWQNWSYQVSIREVNSEKSVLHTNINSTSYKIADLKENTEYIIKAAAYTPSGQGPWSSEFRGLTLSHSKNPIIYWSAARGLLKSDAAGENVETLIHKSNMKNFSFVDMTWYHNRIYLVTNDSHVYWYNIFTHREGRLIDIDSVGSIAVDWLGMKLYWSNPKRQMIIRGNLNGTQQEPLPIVTLAKELNIDSLKAYLYWSTGFAVKCAHLNGEDAFDYHPVQLFSGRQVMGLTLDVDNKYVYWIVRGSEGSNLFRAPMAGYSSTKITVEKISSLQRPNMQGPLCYYHKRLLWLQDDKNAAISDLRGKNIATISGKSMSDITLVYVVDSSLHIHPDSPSGNVVVIPEMVDRNSVRVVGSLNSFNVTWSPIRNVNYGTVFYEVKIDSLTSNDPTVVTTENSIKYWQLVSPFTELHVAIRAFTYWGTSPHIRGKVFSPSSTPSTPRNLRSFVTHQHSGESTNITVTVRWDLPLFPNGLIQGYRVHCWYLNEEGKMNICNNMVKAPNEFQMDLRELEMDRIYEFNVQAFSEIGDGELSRTISVNSSRESPLPRLLIASGDSILIQDIDSNKNESLLNAINTPLQIGYSLKESKIFWINQMHDLMVYDMVTTNKTKLMDLKKSASSLTVDWLERSLYYTQANETSSSIYKIDLNYKDSIKSTLIFATNASILKIEVSPYSKKLYWLENERMMVSNLDGSEIREFLTNSLGNESCNCPQAKIEKSFTLDHSTDLKPLLIFLDSNHNIVSSDSNGCFCEIVINQRVLNSSNIHRINSDFESLYWTNNQSLFALSKNDSSIAIRKLPLQDLLIFGPHTQPFPPRTCLTPKQHGNMVVSLSYALATSLTLIMPDKDIVRECSTTSTATREYRIYYTQLNNSITSCQNRECNMTATFDKEFTINNLKPFTKYVVAVALRNFYTEEADVVIGPPVVFQTHVGAPTEPQNVTARVLNPSMVEVHWAPPQQFNGATVYYEIYWKTERTVSGVRQMDQPVVEKQISPNSSQLLTTVLSKLSPNETYTIWVKAYSETNDTSTDSERVQVNTYAEPSDLVLVNRTAYVLKLTWRVSPYVDKYHVQFSPLTMNDWKTIPVGDRSVGNIVIIAENLKPKTQYKFRLSLLYKNHSDVYIWPPEPKFTYETQGDIPSPPGVPKIQYVRPNIYKVWWEASQDNGAPIELYKLEGLELPNYRTKRSTNRTAFFHTAPSIEEVEREWRHFYNGTDTSWIIDGLSDKFKYEFRVLALNSYGWGPASEPSTAFDLNEAARMAEKQSPINQIFIGTFTPVTVIFFIIACFFCRKWGKPKKLPMVAIPTAPDVELANLREFPLRGIHSANLLYVSTQPTSAELTLLPHIRRDQITLMKFLGSGAFGEVFEGKARGISSNAETRVAVKTLRKGASDLEKTEFLQEAQLMSNFKHEHILQLLGVCLDNDPHFIIMELMEGGDLLTYLRSSRNNTLLDAQALTLIQLLKMCVDVAKGCRYLEEMHFVHRDLACRNCLVSSKESDNHIVKIGDFGLARDIYKNDYYRKEGEGLLPVRWMAPESLVDGVFTSQTDVWAFGVLLWEIMTLGQQPYPARNNIEVLNYVKGGGRLGKPTDCPETLHNLMLKCWEFSGDKRPTFKYCLEVLESLYLQNVSTATTGAHEGQYISTVQECEADEEIIREKTPFLPLEGSATPKYLELVYEATPNDGYEVPTKMPPSEMDIKRSSSTTSDKFNNNTQAEGKDSNAETSVITEEATSLCAE